MRVTLPHSGCSIQNTFAFGSRIGGWWGTFHDAFFRFCAAGIGFRGVPSVAYGHSAFRGLFEFVECHRHLEDDPEWKTSKVGCYPLSSCPVFAYSLPKHYRYCRQTKHQ